MDVETPSDIDPDLQVRLLEKQKRMTSLETIQEARYWTPLLLMTVVLGALWFAVNYFNDLNGSKVEWYKNESYRQLQAVKKMCPDLNVVYDLEIVKGQISWICKVPVTSPATP